MPKVTVYIRNEDYDKWKAVEGKTEFIHAALNALGAVGVRLDTNPDGKPAIVEQKGVWAGPLFRDKKKSKL